jgi:glyoxylase-like metal-dependent hydrolase (beta-lactamase superfamily II)
LKQEQTITYLMECRGGYLQVDTGYQQDYAAYRRFLEKRGIPLARIRFLLLTHHHDDHAGYLNELTRDNPEVRILAHVRAARLLQQGENDKSNGGGLLNRRIYLLFRLKQILTPDWDLTFAPFALRERDILVEEHARDLSAETGIDGLLLHTPGHSSDSISLLRKDGALFCGDLAANFLSWAGAHHATLFNEDVEQLYDAWRRVLERGAKRIYPSHGSPFDAAVLEKEMGYHRNENLVTFF